LGGCAAKGRWVLQSASIPHRERRIIYGWLFDVSGLSYWGNHRMLKDKSETYSSKAATPTSDIICASCSFVALFSRCYKALARAIELFVYFYNDDNSRKDGIRNIRHT
jgi:hypothetical protein